MKKVILLSILTISLGLSSCKNKAAEKAKQEAKEFNEYVDSVNNANPIYSEDNWMVIDMEYQERAFKAEAALEKLQKEDSAKIADSKLKYADLKARYEVAIAKNKELKDQRIRLRNSLFGEGKIGDDISFAFVTDKNALLVYKSFVESVSKNKDNYSREDWDEIKVLYEALDTRKNEIEKELSTSDNLKIANLKMRFASINTGNRPGSKIDENSEAKK